MANHSPIDADSRTGNGATAACVIQGMAHLALGILNFLCESGIVEAALEGIAYKAPASMGPAETFVVNLDYDVPADAEHFIRLGLSDRR